MDFGTHQLRIRLKAEVDVAIGQENVVMGFQPVMKADWVKQMQQPGFTVKIRVKAHGTAGEKEVGDAMKAKQAQKGYLEVEKE